MQAVYFRELNAADISTLHVCCWPEKDRTVIVELAQRVQKMAEQRRGGAVVAVVDGRVCAFGMVTLWREIGEISDLVVHPAIRGQGIGTGMIEQLSTLAQKLGATILEIGAKVENTRALALYQRLEFEAHRTVELLADAPILYLRKQI